VANYTFCEHVFGYSRWHIRDTEYQVPDYPTYRRHKPQKVALCGLPTVRDIDTPINPYNLNRNTCTGCFKAYIDLAKGNRNE
jgi:hypothetical protein